MILTQSRDPRFITIRRGGTLSDANHHLLATWAAVCAEHVLPFFEECRSGDNRPRHAIEQTHVWVRGKTTVRHAREAAYAAGQAVVVAHVAAHELGAAYAIISVGLCSTPGQHQMIRFCTD